jgi:hypothetical protein
MNNFAATMWNRAFGTSPSGAVRRMPHVVTSSSSRVSLDLTPQGRKLLLTAVRNEAVRRAAWRQEEAQHALALIARQLGDED